MPQADCYLTHTHPTLQGVPAVAPTTHPWNATATQSLLVEEMLEFMVGVSQQMAQQGLSLARDQGADRAATAASAVAAVAAVIAAAEGKDAETAAAASGIPQELSSVPPTATERVPLSPQGIPLSSLAVNGHIPAAAADPRPATLPGLGGRGGPLPPLVVTARNPHMYPDLLGGGGGRGGRRGRDR